MLVYLCGRIAVSNVRMYCKKSSLESWAWQVCNPLNRNPEFQDQESSQQTQSVRDSQQVSQSQGYSKPENVSQFSPAPQHSMGSNAGGDRISSLDSLEMSTARHERERISSFRSSDMDGGEEQESIGSVGTPRGARCVLGARRSALKRRLGPCDLQGVMIWCSEKGLGFRGL